MNLERILKKIESEDPASGIGTAAATAGILAASLVMKVANKSKLEKLQKEAEEIKQELRKLIKEDAKAYRDYIKAYKTKDEKKIKKALKYVIETPMKIAEQGYKILELSKTAFEEGKKSLALEVYGASLLGSITVTASLKIAELNLKDLKDEKYEEKIKSKKQDLYTKSRYKETGIYFRIFPPKQRRH